ncbi:MAG: hypothetical protein Q8M06_08535, partial [Methanobacteriaceae archaeon]|nr:hypothetical protein [Methanobacteriaceae archaeon]
AVTGNLVILPEIKAIIKTIIRKNNMSNIFLSPFWGMYDVVEKYCYIINPTGLKLIININDSPIH